MESAIRKEVHHFEEKGKSIGYGQGEEKWR